MFLKQIAFKFLFESDENINSCGVQIRQAIINKIYILSYKMH